VLLLPDKVAGADNRGVAGSALALGREVEKLSGVDTALGPYGTEVLVGVYVIESSVMEMATAG
jgi:hypothetical protein